MSRSKPDVASPMLKISVKRPIYHVVTDGRGNVLEDTRPPELRTELTSIGEQYVIPGCEKHERPAGSQLKLWER